jgi:Domain of unknown function (DUF6305)
MRTKSALRAAAVAIGLIVTLPVASAQDKAAPLDLPVLVTSSGQSLDAFTVKTLLTRAGVNVDYDPRAAVDKLDGKKTLIIVAGASVKGFGAAGITAETELARTRALLDAAKANKIAVVGVHIGGTERRGGASEQFVKAVGTAADRLVVTKEGDQDGYFSGVAKERGIPLTLIDRPLEVGPALTQQFANAGKATN